MNGLPNGSVLFLLGVVVTAATALLVPALNAYFRHGADKATAEGVAAQGLGVLNDKLQDEIKRLEDVCKQAEWERDQWKEMATRTLMAANTATTIAQSKKTDGP